MVVTDTTGMLDGVMIDPVTGEIIDQKDLAERLLAQAKEQGVSLVGPGGLLNQLTKNVLETALEAELTEHLGHEHGGVPIGVKVRDGQVRNTPFYVVMGVTTSGEREILGIWAGDGAEGARFWLQVFSELKNRGVEDVLIAVCDGLKGLPEAITTTWDRTVVQQCVVHLIRNSFRYAGRQHRDGIVKALKPVYTAPSEKAAKDRFAEFAAEWAIATQR